MLPGQWVTTPVDLGLAVFLTVILLEEHILSDLKGSLILFVRPAMVLLGEVRLCNGWFQ